MNKVNVHLNADPMTTWGSGLNAFGPRLVTSREMNTGRKDKTPWIEGDEEVLVMSFIPKPGQLERSHDGLVHHSFLPAFKDCEKPGRLFICLFWNGRSEVVLERSERNTVQWLEHVRTVWGNEHKDDPMFSKNVENLRVCMSSAVVHHQERLLLRHLKFSPSSLDLGDKD